MVIDRKANCKILNDDEYLQELDKKLFEEAHEFIEEHSVEELADLMEVISAIIKLRNISLENVEKARKIKINKKESRKSCSHINLKSDYASSAKYLIVLTIWLVYEFSLSYQETT